MLKLSFSNKWIEAGCDEAGRGCLAGPVFAAAVILPGKFENEILNDSKLLQEKDRDELRLIIEQEAVAWAVASVDNHRIDEINILNASFLAMHLALDQLKKVPELLLIDGNRFQPYKKLRHECIIQGDGQYMPIAAASVLAKTHRDEYMKKLHLEFPHYDWINNKGYSTPGHRAAIAEFGLTPYHRRSFNMSVQLKMEL